MVIKDFGRAATFPPGVHEVPRFPPRHWKYCVSTFYNRVRSGFHGAKAVKLRDQAASRKGGRINVGLRNLPDAPNMHSGTSLKAARLRGKGRGRIRDLMEVKQTL